MTPSDSGDMHEQGDLLWERTDELLERGQFIQTKSTCSAALDRQKKYDMQGTLEGHQNHVELLVSRVGARAFLDRADDVDTDYAPALDLNKRT